MLLPVFDLFFGERLGFQNSEVFPVLGFGDCDEIEASGEDDIVIDDEDFVVRGSVSRVKESRNTGF